MAEAALSLPHSAPYTVYDLLAMPDDGSRYEVIDGTLLVSPAPGIRHQAIADRLRNLLAAAAPPGVEVLTAVAVRCGEDGTGPVPDVVAATVDVESCTDTVLEAAQVLAVVEVVSPGSRRQDRTTKPEIYAAAGIGTYWRVELDPFPGQGTDGLPVVLVHELSGGAYKLVARLAAGAPGETSAPFLVRFDPGGLLRRR